jgi:uncharacterized protein (DUF2384 family)
VQIFSEMTNSPAILPSAGWGFPTANIILQARQKLPRSQVDVVATLGGLTKKEIALALGITERNLYNAHQSELSVPLSERVILLEKLFRHGLAVFDGQRDAFAGWLRTPLPELATPEVGFAAPLTDYMPSPIAEMGTKEGPGDLGAAAKARRSRLAGQPPEPLRPYPTPLSLLDTVTGCQLVDYVFTRIEAGVFS